MNNFYSELAMENFQNIEIDPNHIKIDSFKIKEISITKAEVKSEKAKKETGKDIGTYFTIDLDYYKMRKENCFPNTLDAVSHCIKQLTENASEAVLVAGLGNRSITPDALGSFVIDDILVTNHIFSHEPSLSVDFNRVSAIATGVLGTTGIESAEIVKSLAEKTSSNIIIAVDALACSSIEGLCKTIQISNTGISPGSGVGNARLAINKEKMGRNVIAVGVPTVVDGRNFTGCSESVIVTTKDISKQIAEIAKIIAYSINLSLQDNFSLEDLQTLLS